MTDVKTSPSITHMYSLPNEIFVQVLSPFPTRSLLPLAAVSQRFHAVVLRLLHQRLWLAASLKHCKLILECYHPTAKLTEPHVFCEYLGTDGLNDQHEGKRPFYENIDISHQLGRLNSLYSRFRPKVAVEGSPGDMEEPSHGDDSGLKMAINLEGFEDFSQLCVLVNVVKVLSGTRLLLSATTVNEGVVRLFRDRLRDHAKRFRARDNKNHSSFESHGNPEDHMLWVGWNRDVGLKIRVREKTGSDHPFPVLVHRDDEDRFSRYELYIDELHIRTTRLLLPVEKLLQEQGNYPKAIVFATKRSS